MLSSRGNETSKAPIQRGVGERNPTPDALERTAFEMEMLLFRNIQISSYWQGGGRRPRRSRDSSATHIPAGYTQGSPVKQGFVWKLIRKAHNINIGKLA